MPKKTLNMTPTFARWWPGSRYRATGVGDAMTGEQRVCHLLNLPAELRLQIYEYCFDTDSKYGAALHIHSNGEVMDVLRLQGFGNTELRDTGLALLLTCKVLHHEVLPLFYAGFKLNLRVGGIPDSIYWRQQFTAVKHLQSLYCLTQIHHFKLYVDIHSRLGKREIPSNATRMEAAIKTVDHLREVMLAGENGQCVGLVLLAPRTMAAETGGLFDALDRLGWIDGARFHWPFVGHKLQPESSWHELVRKHNGVFCPATLYAWDAIRFRRARPQHV